MVGGDDMTEGSISSRFLSSEDFPKQVEDDLSSEDVAWVDSCLIKDPDILECNWNSLTDALLDILSSQPAREYGSAKGSEVKILPSPEGTGTSQDLDRTVDSILRTNDESEMSIDDHLMNENTDALWSTSLGNSFLLTDQEEGNVDDIFRNQEAAAKSSDDHLSDEKETSWSRSNLENVFLPTYREDQRETEGSDAEGDWGFQSSVVEPSTEDIFKVWDLKIPAEEDELFEQLKKAFSESHSQPTPPTSDDSGVWKGPKEHSLDDLISGFTDLSLNQSSS
ncbi:hypothetical protein RJ640_017137 [Escallonia rubra]|uniref:Uncharacterized protein n=1 Tax=Escallonia rubra TaxID=112253 RepID=A0AA88UDR7_9ASTE|nr:hypothetical protein RJ640_017137 [Escallonia rubra]